MLTFASNSVSCLFSDFTVFVFPGYRIRAGSASPIHGREASHRFGSDYNHLSQSRGYGGGRDPGRYRDPSPPYFRGKVGGRAIGRAFDRPGFVPGLARGEGNSRNNPNVRPREGDWICPDIRCGNLNFARRDHCNKCNRSRPAPAESPRRAYPGPPPFHSSPRRFPSSPERTVTGYRSPPRGLARDGPREYGSAALPPLRHEGRFTDPHLHRDRVDYLEDDYRGRNKFDRPAPPPEWDSRDRGRYGFSNERKAFERRPLSPPAPPLPSLPPHHGGRWAQDVRERSRSPIRGAPLPPKDYHRDMFVNRGRDDRRALGRDRIGGMY
ncbi:putative Zinc finger, RanBP2-type, TAF15/EWS/TLS family [Lupinus albus]|uniref:Putative Zinc finger, RanBP2-type, TAF15/EWS/TLS family n=1 Tax=Lupinus albus TaxID=3870 RepID=A0A6A4N7B2_LUPAL|nr:putative Zinc finger, RanBP2-type, TAF15/EWS/TLS family [Lupinus albus]